MHILHSQYRERFQKDPGSDPDLVYFLGDNPDYTVNWSAVSGKIPTFRRNAASGKFWFPSAARWMTCAEKRLGVAMG